MSRKKQFRERRITAVFIIFLVMSAAIMGRLFSLQILNHGEYTRLARKQRGFEEVLKPERGKIYFQDKNSNLILAAGNKEWKTIIADPRLIANSEETANNLSKILKINKDEIIKKIFKKEDPYEIIAKKIDDDIADQIKNLDLEGITLESERKRIYPLGRQASQILGFVSYGNEEEEGQYGLEEFLDKDLRGEKGFFAGEKDTSGFWIALGKRILNPPKNGSSAVLTIDQNIQSKIELELETLKKKWGASGGHILVIDPKTGRILAEAVDPSFDPNEYSRVKNLSVFLNPAVESTFELGSVLKPITMAGGLDNGVITPETTYTDTGEVKIKGYTIKNFDGKAHGIQTMTQVLEQSLNTGAMYVGNLLGKERFKTNLEKFGFGEKTGIDLPGEVAGNISNLSNMRDIDYATASFGQGISVTPLQLAMAISAIANEGKLMKPYIIDKIIDESGAEVKTEPQVKREVIKKETAEMLTKMLVSVVRVGYDNRAGVKGYFVAGKTGTAQIPRSDGKGYSDKVIHSFVGYAPAFNPRFLILIQLNEPTGNRFAANTLPASFRNLAGYILNYYEIPPDEERSE